MQLINTYNKVIRFLFCPIDIFSKYAWVVPLNDKKGVSIINAFQKVDDDVKVYSTYSEGKSVVAERFIKALKNKIYNWMQYKHIPQNY